MRPKKCVGGASGGQGSSRGRIEELSIRGFYSGDVCGGYEVEER